MRAEFRAAELRADELRAAACLQPDVYNLAAETMGLDKASARQIARNSAQRRNAARFAAIRRSPP